MITIFISYGHDEYASFADRLYDAFSALRTPEGEAKYQVFKDTRGGIRDTYQWDRELSVSYERMGNIALREHKTDDAKEYYAAALEIDLRNAEEFPSYESRRDLAISYGRMGDIALQEDRVEEAKQYYYAAGLELDRRNAEEHPSHESRSDRMIHCLRLGKCCKKEGEKGQAAEYFREALHAAEAKLPPDADPAEDEDVKECRNLLNDLKNGSESLSVKKYK